MRKKISEMTAKDKVEFLEQTKQAMIREHGVDWEFIEPTILEDIENTFDDKKFVEMDPDFRIDAAYARKEFGDKKPELVDYLLWIFKFVTHSEYVDW